MSRPALIVNPSARRLAQRPRLLSAIRRATADRADLFEPRTFEQLDDAARRIVDSGADRVLLVGGDGSTMVSLTALFRAAAGRPLPPIAIAHAGTVGTIARSLGLRLPVLEAVDGICDASRGTAFEQPTLAVTEASGEQRIGFIFGTGLVSGFFDKYDTAGGGLAAAALIVLRLFVGSMIGTQYAREVLSPMQCRLTVDGRLLEPDAWGVIVSSVLSDVGLHVRVTYRGSEDPERPHLVATPLGPRGLGMNFPRVLRGQRIRGAGTFDDLVESFRVDFGPDEGVVILDGDTIRTRAITVRAGPRLTMLRL